MNADKKMTRVSFRTELQRKANLAWYHVLEMVHGQAPRRVGMRPRRATENENLLNVFPTTCGLHEGIFEGVSARQARGLRWRLASSKKQFGKGEPLR
jgi:hypothetical protein